MKSRDVHYWRRRLLAACLRRRQRLARKTSERYRNPGVLAMAAPTMARATSPETGRIRTCSFRRPPIRATLPNLRFSFSDAHMRQTSGGWTRQVTARELVFPRTLPAWICA